MDRAARRRHLHRDRRRASVNPSVAAAAIGTVPVAKSGMASGLNSTFRLLGVAVGVALLGAIVETEVAASLAQSSAGGAARARRRGRHRQRRRRGCRGAAGAAEVDVAVAAETAFVAGFDTIQLVAAVIAFTGAVLALALVRQRDFVAARGADAEPAPAAG